MLGSLSNTLFSATTKLGSVQTRCKLPQVTIRFFNAREDHIKQIQSLKIMWALHGSYKFGPRRYSLKPQKDQIRSLVFSGTIKSSRPKFPNQLGNSPQLLLADSKKTLLPKLEFF
jgi:hypothetical protein